MNDEIIEISITFKLKVLLKPIELSIDEIANELESDIFKAMRYFVDDREFGPLLFDVGENEYEILN